MSQVDMVLMTCPFKDDTPMEDRLIKIYVSTLRHHKFYRPEHIEEIEHLMIKHFGEGFERRLVWKILSDGEIIYDWLDRD